jgi:hypothetical protein
LGPGNRSPAFPFHKALPASLASVLPEAFVHLQPPNASNPSATSLSSDLRRDLTASVQAQVKQSFAEAIAAGQLIIPPKANRLPPLPLPSLQALLDLRQFLGDPNASFRSPEQAIAFDLVRRCVPSALFVLPTGMGKSLLFIFCAWLLLRESSDSFVVVFVPFRALLTDIIRRCRAMKVGVTSLDFSETSQSHEMLEDIGNTIVLISADQGSSSTMVEFVKEARRMGRLRCIFIDECHLLVDDFRPGLKKLVVEDRIGVPIFMNSGSLTPAEERTLLEMFRKYRFIGLFTVSSYLSMTSYQRSSCRTRPYYSPQHRVCDPYCQEEIVPGFPYETPSNYEGEIS